MRKTKSPPQLAYPARKALPPPEPSVKDGDNLNGSASAKHDDTDETISSLRRMFMRRRAKPKVAPGAQQEFEQQIHALLVSILNMIDKRGSAVIAITAATRGEGASTIAASLAKIASQQDWCRVALMDGARPPQKSEFSDTASAEPPVRERQFTDDVKLPAPLQDRHALALMPSAPKGGQLRSPDSLRKLYATLRDAVTLVIIDCPPVMEANETPSLAAAADGVILVVEENQSRIAVIKRARTTLERAGAKIIGVVLNKQEQFIPSFLYNRL